MIAPATEEELVGLVRSGRPIHAIGSGTKRHHGPAAAAGVEDVSMRKLGRVVSHEPGDLVVTVQAGCRLADLQAELGRKGQWLPLDPPYGDATIGGILATNGSGPRRLGHGTARDHLLGLKVMGADGVTTRSGGRVVKNVTGYDLHKLHIGAFGTLGILLEADFKLRPKPEITAAVVISCPSVQDAHALCLKVFASALRPVALEAMDGRLKHIVDAPALAIVGLEGSRPVLDRHYRELKAFGKPTGVLEGAMGDQVWTALRRLPEALRDYVRVRIGAKPHDLPKLLPAAPVWIQAGTGIARADFEAAPGVGAQVRQLHAKAQAAGGYAVVESAPLDLPDREKLPWGGPLHGLHRGLKDVRDPKKILNPGRISV